MNATSSWYGTTGAHPGFAGPIPPQPYAPTRWPVWRILDLVATISLFGVYAFEVLALLYFSIFWAMAADSCGTAGCDYGKLDTAYFLNDVCGIVVYLVTLVVAVVLLVLRRPAFWLPLLGGLIQIALLVAALEQLAGVSPT
jgi:hypothetical protein